jgi:hypothetical protein
MEIALRRAMDELLGDKADGVRSLMNTASSGAPAFYATR